MKEKNLYFVNENSFKVVVNIPVDMYHFCINKITLVESASVFFLYFQGFMYYVICIFTDFSNGRICCRYPARQSCFKTRTMSCPYEEKTA